MPAATSATTLKTTSESKGIVSKTAIMAAVYLLCLVPGAFADQVNCVKWKDSSGLTVGTYCKPFTIKAGPNVSFSDDQSLRVLTIAASSSASPIAGEFVVDGSAYTTIQSAITAAGTTGSVLIPSTYAGTDVYTNTNGIQIIDLRRVNSSPSRWRGFINVLTDCGLKGDGVTDDSTAANACLTAYPSAQFFFPQTRFGAYPNAACSYMFNSFLYPRGVSTEIRGEAGGSWTGGGTTLCFAPNTTGIWLDNTDCPGCKIDNIALLGGNDTVGVTPQNFLIPNATNLNVYNRSISTIQRAGNALTVVTSPDNGIEGLTQQVGSIIKITGVVGDVTMNGTCIVATITASGGTAGNPNGFTCAQNGADSGPFGAVGTIGLATTSTNSADGIRVCANFAFIDHVMVRGFARHGVNADSTPGAGCATNFSDDLIMSNSSLYSNQGFGFYCHGGNCNAGYMVGNILYNNVLWGMYDIGALPNGWTANQASNNGSGGWNSIAQPTKVISAISRTLSVSDSTVSVTIASPDTTIKVGNGVVISGVTDASFNTAAGSAFFVTAVTDSTHYQYIQPGAPANASSSGGTSQLAKFTEVGLASGTDNGAYKIQSNGALGGTFISNYIEGGQNCKYGRTLLVLNSATSCAPSEDWVGKFFLSNGLTGLSGFVANQDGFGNNLDSSYTIKFRAGVNGGTARTVNHSFINSNDSSLAWTLAVDPSGFNGASGSYVLTRGSVRRLGFFASSGGVTRIDSESTAAVEVNNDPNSGTGGLKIMSGGASPTTVTTVDSTGKGTFNGGIVVGASGSTISDSRELIQNAHSCGTTTTCANTANGSNRMVFGSVALSSGTPSTATVASITPFTSSASYFCVVTNATSQANPLKVANVSSSSFTITGPNTVTDTVNFQCVGN